MYISIFIGLGIIIACILYFIGSYIKNSSFGTDFFGTGSTNLGFYKDHDFKTRYASEPNFEYIIDQKYLP